MKIKTLFLLTFVLLTNIKLHAQSTPPKPVELLFLKNIEGTWTGQSEMMGTKMNEVLTCRRDYNKQYLIIDLRVANEDKTHTYSALGVYGADADGNVTSWWFDDWGAESVSIGKGKIEGNVLTLDSQRPNFTMHRTFELSGTTLTMKWTSTMKDKDGKDDTLSGETIYTKKD